MPVPGIDLPCSRLNTPKILSKYRGSIPMPLSVTAKSQCSLCRVAETWTSGGRALFTDYAFAFEVTSVLILVAMVGAVVLARRDDPRDRRDRGGV